MPKRVVSGIVTSDKMSKTRRVEINRLVKHPKYKKYIRRRTVCYAHDEEGAYAAGESYFPEEIADKEYYQPVERGLEQKIREKLAYLRSLDKVSSNKRYK